ncbi:Signal transduction histidine-protein kinase BaeS [Cedecea neteri]|uniref:Signal transduction histidine-protein kinase BaeS n=1 Tax=Cedecea neteri TaxID=158822 RepID=A0A2X3J8Z8_9ENTR|nr:Signal transduction histidine-protein kinase BaeS [Cedecea neteri]
MKLWRSGITGKLFLAIFSTCLLVLAIMHWGVRLSFERGFIDYIKRGNTQRIEMLSDALGEQYALHGNWRFLRHNDRFVFQILRSFERDGDEAHGMPRRVGAPSFGWSIKTLRYWLAHERSFPTTGCAKRLTSMARTWAG